MHPPNQYFLVIITILGLLLWFCPRVTSLVLRRRAYAGTIVVLADDLLLTELALDLCQKRPLHTLWVCLGALQLATLRQRQRCGLSPQSDHCRVLLEGRDTVRQFIALSHMFPVSEHQLLLITDSAHRDSPLVIARQVLGGLGVLVDTPPITAAT